MFHIVVSYCLKTPAFNYTPGCHVAVGMQTYPTPNLTIVSALDTFTLPSNLKFYTDTEVKGLALPTSTDNTTQNAEEQQVQACERMKNQPLAASYVNYYLVNGAVVLP